MSHNLAGSIFKFPLPLLGNIVGIPGLPTGRITQFRDSINSDQATFLSMIMVKTALQNAPGCRVTWIDTGLCFNYRLANLVGLDLTRVDIISSNDIALVFTYLLGGSTHAAGLLEKISDNLSCVKLIVLDSINGLAAPDNYEIGRLLPKPVRLVHKALTKTNASMIVTKRCDAGPQQGQTYRTHLSISVDMDQTSLDNEESIVIATIDKSHFSDVGARTGFVTRKDLATIYSGAQLVEFAVRKGIIKNVDATTLCYNDHIGSSQSLSRLLESNNEILVEVLEKCKMSYTKTIQ